MGQYIPHEMPKPAEDPAVDTAGENTADIRQFYPEPETVIPPRNPGVIIPDDPEPVVPEMPTHFTHENEITQAVDAAEREIAEQFKHEQFGSAIDREEERLLTLSPLSDIVRINPRGKKAYADDLVNAIAQQMMAQAFGEAEARAIQMVNSRAHINEFLENTTGILRVVLSILRECKIRVPLRIGFDPQTRQLEWDYLDFEHGVNFSMSDIIKGLTYLNMEYGPTSKRVQDMSVLLHRTNDVNARLVEQMDTLTKAYNDLQAEYVRLQEIEEKYNAVQIVPLESNERQFVLYRSFTAPAKATREEKRTLRKFRPLLEDQRDERWYKGAPVPHKEIDEMMGRLPIRTEANPAIELREMWIGVSDSDNRVKGERNELDPDEYVGVSSIGEALKFRTQDEADAVLNRLIDLRKLAKNKKLKKKHTYNGPKNPQLYAVHQIVMRKV